MEENIVEEIVRERIRENKELFNKDEYNILEGNINLAKKMYILGFINARNIYGNNLQWNFPIFSRLSFEKYINYSNK